MHLRLLTRRPFCTISRPVPTRWPPATRAGRGLGPSRWHSTTSSALVRCCSGQVLLWYHVAEGQAQCTLARLVEVRAGSLLLAYDKDGQQVTIPWWQTDPTRPLFRVTHYLTPPVGLVPPELPALLLELTTDEMSPRYPRGARYIIRPVPADAWPQARGVHALALLDGRQLVRRIFHQANGVLALASDRTDDVQTLPLAELASLWKLGKATYLPEETEAEHQWMVQRPAC